MLEPYEGKLSRTVLRGEGGSNALDLPDDALAPYHLHSQVPLTEESTALVRSKCIPGVTKTDHNTMKKIKELTTQNDANERKNHRKRLEEIYFPYICAVTETSN